MRREETSNERRAEKRSVRTCSQKICDDLRLIGGIDAEEGMHARVLPDGCIIEAPVPPLLPRGPRPLRLVVEPLHIDIDNVEVSVGEELSPRVERAGGLVSHAKFEHVRHSLPPGPQHHVVRGTVVVLRQPVRALVGAPLVEERVEQRVVVGRAAVGEAARPLRQITIWEALLRPRHRGEQPPRAGSHM